jgi:hypothetical protein
MAHNRAEEGAEGARELLALTPCDLWPYLAGRTLWLVGDSMMQAGAAQLPSCPAARLPGCPAAQRCPAAQLPKHSYRALCMRTLHAWS